MSWRTQVAAFAAALASLVSLAGHAQSTLYAATGSNGVNGQLFVVNGTTGASTLIGPIVLPGALPVSVTGLAVSPATGLLYGVTAGLSPNIPRTLILINAASGAATQIGVTGSVIASDLAFDSAGTLYAWNQNTNTLNTVNVSTGVATPLGASGVVGTTGGGLAIAPGNQGFLSVSTATGTIDRINIATGARTVGPAMTGATFANSMNAMAAANNGTLYAVNSNNGGVALTRLVTINTATGVVTVLGTLPNDTDALAFVPSPDAVPTLSEWALIVMILLLGISGALAVGRNVRVG